MIATVATTNYDVGFSALTNPDRAIDSRNNQPFTPSTD